jgi:FtsH-binding integral membrane protein
VFACFSAAALIAERRSFLFLGGMIGSGLTTLFWLSFLNIFFGSYVVFNIQLYLGLLVFSGFIIFDTQLMIERALMDPQNADFVRTYFFLIDIFLMIYLGDSLELFLDFLNVFIRLLIILTKNRKKSDRK